MNHDCSLLSNWFTLPRADDPTSNYTPVYSDWNGWVRTGPDRIGDLTLADPYSRAQVGALSHPALRQLSDRAQQELLTLHLYAYLDFTVFIELDLVNPVNRDLAHDAFALNLPNSARLDAVRIYADEAAHSSFSLDLKYQAIEQLGVEPVASAPHQRANLALDAIAQSVTDDQRRHSRLFQAVATETLITSNLSKVARDVTVNPIVRAVLEDHADDEAVHHRFFSKVLREFWRALTEEGKRACVQTVVDSLDALLLPDPLWLTDALDAVGVPDAFCVAHEITTDPALFSAARRAARPTLALLASLGAFDDPDNGVVAALWR